MRGRVSVDVAAAVAFVQQQLQAAANHEKAGPMAAYMKTTMPFYGVQNPARLEIRKQLTVMVPTLNRTEYRNLVRALWALPFREEKYLAIAVARHHRDQIVPSMLPMYRSMIVTGAWWDFVDEIAINLVGKLLADHPEQIGAEMDRWITDDHLWVRRSAIIAQIKHKEHTDESRLFRYCVERAHETDFFIRKAIGWALREYAKTNPQAVRAFVDKNADQLSGLSRREATKHL